MKRALAALLLATLVSCSSVNRTEVLVTLDAEPGVIALAPKLRVTLRSSDAEGLQVTGTNVDLTSSVVALQTLGSALDPVAYPLDIAIVPQGNDASRRYWLEVTALSANDEAVSQARVISGFVRRQTLALRLVLEDRCVGELACANAQTCRAANCVSAEVEPATLPRYGATPDAGPVTSEQWSFGPTLKSLQNGSYQTLGSAVAIDGDLIALGLPYDSSDAAGVRPFDEVDNYMPETARSGAVAVFHRNPSTGMWSQEAFLKADCPGFDYHFGYAVALDGDVLVVGSPDDASAGATCMLGGTLAASGSAYVYRRSVGGTWTREAYLRSPSPHAGDAFGATVDVSSNRVIVGARFDDSSEASSASVPDPWTGSVRTNPGSAFVYAYGGSSWALEQHLKATMIADEALFGASVAIDGSRIVVGAPVEANQVGRVYVFEYADGAWTARARLVGSRSVGGLDFGRVVALDGARFAAAQLWESSGGIDADPQSSLPLSEDSGAVYTFVVDGTGTWTEETLLKMHSSTRNDGWEGMALALEGDRLAIGYRGEDGTTMGLGTTSNVVDAVDVDSGAVFLYRRTGSGWVFDAYVKSPLQQADAVFGYQVGLAYPFMVVGAPRESSDGTGVLSGPPPVGSQIESGTGYLLQLVPTP